MPEKRIIRVRVSVEGQTFMLDAADPELIGPWLVGIVDVLSLGVGYPGGYPRELLVRVG